MAQKLIIVKRIFNISYFIFYLFYFIFYFLFCANTNRHGLVSWQKLLSCAGLFFIISGDHAGRITLGHHIGSHHTTTTPYPSANSQCCTEIIGTVNETRICTSIWRDTSIHPILIQITRYFVRFYFPPLAGCDTTQSNVLFVFSCPLFYLFILYKKPVYKKPGLSSPKN